MGLSRSGQSRKLRGERSSYFCRASPEPTAGSSSPPTPRPVRAVLRALCFPLSGAIQIPAGSSANCRGWPLAAHAPLATSFAAAAAHLLRHQLTEAPASFSGRLRGERRFQTTLRGFVLVRPRKGRRGAMLRGAGPARAGALSRTCSRPPGWLAVALYFLAWVSSAWGNSFSC